MKRNDILLWGDLCYYSRCIYSGDSSSMLRQILFDRYLWWRTIVRHFIMVYTTHTHDERFEQGAVCLVGLYGVHPNALHILASFSTEAISM